MTKTKGLEKEIEAFDRKLSSFRHASSQVSQMEYLIAMGSLLSELAWFVIHEGDEGEPVPEPPEGGEE